MTGRTREIDVEAARADTPGAAQITHLNNAGASLMPNVVFRTVVDHLELERTRGGYEAAKMAAEQLDDTYGALANLLRCRPSEIALLENATRAWGMVFYAIDFQAGDRILTSRQEYVSNYLAYLQVSERTGARVETVPDDEHGQLSVEALAEMVDERVRLISVTHVPTSSGVINPVVEIGSIARESDAWYLLDACQSVGQIDLDVREIGCDFLSGTSRKYLRGPRGAGFLYVRRDLIERLQPPSIDVRSAVWTAVDRYELRDDAKRFETFEGDTAVRLGLGAATRYALGWGLDAIEARVTGLADGLRERLEQLDGVRLLDTGRRRCGIASFCLDGMGADEVVAALSRVGTNVQAVPVTHSRIDMEDRGVDDLVRASVHYYNTYEDLDRAVAQLSDVLTRRRRKVRR